LIDEAEIMNNGGKSIFYLFFFSFSWRELEEKEDEEPQSPGPSCVPEQYKK